MRTGARQGCHRQMKCCLAARGGNCANPLFKRRHSLFENRHGRIADARIDMTRALHVEKRRGMI